MNCWVVQWCSIHTFLTLFDYLVGGLEHFFFHILGIIIPTDFDIFQRGRSTTNQIRFWHCLTIKLLGGFMYICSFRRSTLVWEWLSHHPSRVFGGLSWFNLKSNSKTKLVPQKNSEKLWKTMICTKKTHFFVAPIPTNFLCKRQRGSDQPAVASSRSSRSYGEPRCRCVHRAIGDFSGDF